MFQFLFGLLALFNTGVSKPDLIAPISDDLIIREKVVEEREDTDIDNNQEGEVKGVQAENGVLLASQVLDLGQRDGNSFVNQVFKDNILLALEYLGAEFVLQPGQVFAFHDNLLEKYEGKVVKTVGSEFNLEEGYLSSGLVVGDGVCHLASLMNLVASEAGLEVQAEVDHNFRPIPGIDREYGTSIRYSREGFNSQNQNLYITNSLDYPVKFRFGVYRDSLGLEIVGEQ